MGNPQVADPVLKAHLIRQKEGIPNNVLPKRAAHIKEREALIAGLDKMDSERRRGVKDTRAKEQAARLNEEADRAEEHGKARLKEAEELRKQAEKVLNPEPPATQSTAPELLPKPDGEPDDLTKIKGIGSAIQKKLNGLGVFHFSQIAAWSEDNAGWIDNELHLKGAVTRSEWVDQAKALTGGE